MIFGDFILLHHIFFSFFIKKKGFFLLNMEKIPIFAPIYRL
jgi:hypothetical protein